MREILATTHALTDAERKSALDAHNLRRSQLAGGKSLNKTGLPMPTGKNIWTMVGNRAGIFCNSNRVGFNFLSDVPARNRQGLGPA